MRALPELVGRSQQLAEAHFGRLYGLVLERCGLAKSDRQGFAKTESTSGDSDKCQTNHNSPDSKESAG